MRLYLFAFAALVFVTLDVHAQETSRGRTLHDAYCMSCHATRVYTRPDRAARDYQQVREQVDRWQKNVSLNWEDADIDLVTAYIASRFYGFDCPAKC
jgi:mono/diheme cytochrome c family protein